MDSTLNLRIPRPRPAPMTESRRRLLWSVIVLAFAVMTGMACLQFARRTSIVGYLRLSEGMTIDEARDTLGAGEAMSIARVPMRNSSDGALRPALSGNYFHRWTYRDGVLGAGFRDGVLVSKCRMSQGE